MHDVLRQRLMRNIEALPESQLYQTLDYVEFLASKYAREAVRAPSSSLQKFGERLEDKMRGQGLTIRTIRGTLGAIGTADRVISGITEAGRTLIRDVASSPRSTNPGLNRGEPTGSDQQPQLPDADAQLPR